MFWIVASIVIVVWIILIFISKKAAGAPSATLYLLTAKEALGQGSSLRDAMKAGLRQIRTQPFFSSLDDVQIMMIADSYAVLNDYTILAQVIKEAQKTNNLSILTNHKTRSEIVVSLMNKLEHRG